MIYGMKLVAVALLTFLSFVAVAAQDQRKQLDASAR